MKLQAQPYTHKTGAASSVQRIWFKSRRSFHSVASNHVPCLCLNVRVNEIPRKTCESKYRLLSVRLCEDLGIQVSPFVLSPSSFGDPFSNFGLRQLSQVFSLYFCCGSLYGVPINQGNYLALRFSVLEFTRQSERQPIRGCKNYLRKKNMAWAKMRGGDLK